MCCLGLLKEIVLIFRFETWGNVFSVFESNILSQFRDLNSAIVHKMETIFIICSLVVGLCKSFW